MVVAPGVEGCERPALVVMGPVADEVLRAGMRQLVDGTLEPEARELLRLAGPRPKAGTPKQSLRLGDSELAVPHRDACHIRDIGSPARKHDP